MEKNNISSELDGWKDINSDGGTIGTGINKAIHKLVVALVNIRLTTSSQLKDLQSKIGTLEESVNKMNGSFHELNNAIKKADKSSTNLSEALNRLTFWGVIIAGTGLIIGLAQFLFENSIWPFNN